MKKIVKKSGNGFIIRLDKEDMVVYDLEEDDIIDVELVKISEPKIRGDNANSRTLPTIQKKEKKQ